MEKSFLTKKQYYVPGFHARNLNQLPNDSYVCKSPVLGGGTNLLRKILTTFYERVSMTAVIWHPYRTVSTLPGQRTIKDPCQGGGRRMKNQDHIIISAREYLGPCHNLNNFLEREEGYEIYYCWPEDVSQVSKGFVYLLKCRPGLLLTISKHYPVTSFNISFNQETTGCIFLSFLIGKGFHVRHHNRKKPIHFDPNQGHITYTHDNQAGMLHFPKDAFCAVGILMEPWLMRRFWEGAAGEFAARLQELLADKTTGDYFHYPLSMSATINVLLHEILRCPYKDGCRHLFLESKTLELMTLSFDQLNPGKKPGVSCFDVAPDSLNFIHKARDILIADIKKPPSLTKLSRMVGVNRTTLNHNFRKVYGVTLFDYLRTYRLEESRRLFRTGKQSVTEVALEVGYSQQATFTREFKKYFGSNPSDHIS